MKNPGLKASVLALALSFSIPNAFAFDCPIDRFLPEGDYYIGHGSAGGGCSGPDQDVIKRSHQAYRHTEYRFKYNRFKHEGTMFFSGSAGCGDGSGCNPVYPIVTLHEKGNDQKGVTCQVTTGSNGKEKIEIVAEVTTGPIKGFKIGLVKDGESYYGYEIYRASRCVHLLPGFRPYDNAFN